MTRKILFADDDLSIRALISASLEDEDDLDVLLASNGVQALELIREELPEVVFLDIAMPLKDGYAVCREIKADPATSHIRVVMLTGLAGMSQIRMAGEAGAEDHYPKPFSPMDLRLYIRTQLSSSVPSAGVR